MIDKRQYIHCWISSLCILSASNICYAYDIDDVADPPAAAVTYVGDVVQNGLPMQMKQFSTEWSLTELFAFYKQRWSDTSNNNENIPDYIEKQVGEWSILSKMEDNKSVVIQARASSQGGIEGYISVTDISRFNKPNRWSSEFPRMYGTQLISNTESVDKGRQAYTLVLANTYSVRENKEYYRENMHSEGWQYTRGREVPNTAMLYFKKESWQCDIAVTQADDGKTIIFANLVEVNESS